MSLKPVFDRIMRGLLVLTTSCLYPVVSIRADDIPKTRCRSIASLARDIRPSDLAELSEAQRFNVEYYLEEQRKSGAAIPPRIHLLDAIKFKDPSFNDVELSFSLIFDSRDCEAKCAGTAVLPGSNGRTLSSFSYRRNLVIRPISGLLPQQNAEREFGSLILLDESGKSLVAFHDLFRNVSKDGTSRQKSYSRSERFKIVSGQNERDRENYFACLRNIFDVDAPMPGSGAR